MQSLPQAANALGLDESTLRHQIRNGKLRATKVARDWFIEDAEVERYRSAHRKQAQNA